MSTEAAAQLQRVFGHADFRPGQADVVDSVLEGRPTLAVMPTGAGKSLCYQLPATMLEGLTLVVSPLIALIRDQVRALKDKGIAAASLTSLDRGEDRQDTLHKLETGALDLLYVAPERFRSSRFLEQVARQNLALFVVDEAHCISQWGHDFRPDYARLGDIVAKLEPPRIAALTATATAEVRGHIAAQLGLQDPNVIVTGFDRPNLELSVEETARGKAKMQATLRALETWTGDGGAAIVYVATRKKTNQVAEALAEAGHDAHAYHAGLDPARRREVELHFTRAEKPVVVATTAFGMGIDRADVRAVVHFQIPNSVEAYYQEVGRAGRDGDPAGGVLIYDSGDLRYAYMKHQASCPTPEAVARSFAIAAEEAAAPRGFDGWVERLEPEVGPAARAALIALEQAGDLAITGHGVEVFGPEPTVDPVGLETRARRERARLDAMIGYVMRAPCRRRYLVDYFGDTRRPDRCGRCDRCAAPEPRTLEDEARRHALMALSCVARMRGRYGKTRVADVLLGSRAQAVLDAGLDTLSTHGLLSDWSRPEVLALLDALVRAELTQITGTDYPKLMLSAGGAEALKNNGVIALDLRLARWGDADAMPSKKKRGGGGAPPELEGPEQALFEALRSWRGDTAKSIGKPPYVIAHDRLLAEIAASRPKSDEDLLALSGIGPSKLEKYGADILRIVREAT